MKDLIEQAKNVLLGEAAINKEVVKAAEKNVKKIKHPLIKKITVKPNRYTIELSNADGDAVSRNYDRLGKDNFFITHPDKGWGTYVIMGISDYGDGVTVSVDNRAPVDKINQLLKKIL